MVHQNTHKAQRICAQLGRCRREERRGEERRGENESSLDATALVGASVYQRTVGAKVVPEPEPETEPVPGPGTPTCHAPSWITAQT